MKSIGRITGALILTALAVWQAPFLAQGQAPRELSVGAYTAAQADAGKTAYDRGCASCHGSNLDNGAFAPALKGAALIEHYRNLEGLFTTMSTTMPPNNPGSLGTATYVQVLAFLLQQNGIAPGATELPVDVTRLAAMTFPGRTAVTNSAVSNAPRVAQSKVLAAYSPVTDQTLKQPGPGDWLLWRRDLESQGFSPLKTIDRSNVRQLRSTWSWSLPVGTTESIPVVHDGVMFVFGAGDRMQALDAASGDLLWQYVAPPPSFTGRRGSEQPNVRRGIAVYGNKVYVGTNDVHVIALDVKTGRVAWDQAVGDPSTREGIAGGPLVAQGKVMIGTTGTQTGSKPGGPKIVGLDAETGRIAWQVNTIAQPGTNGGNSWNGVPVDKRSGASIWSTGSYDAESKLAFFGTGNTYDTLPLTEPIHQEGVSAELLYTDSTLAINPDTGALVWYYQHHTHELWDMDWAFEQIVVTVPVDGKPTRAVLTMGKLGIYDALDAKTGRYLFSIDAGLQNLITAIDPKTGAKTANPDLIPRNNEPKTYCPSSAGAKNWIPASYNPNTKTAYVPLIEACTDLRLSPGGPGTGALTSGYLFVATPRPNSDGNFGRIQAIDIETRKTLWTARHRAPETSGVLATAGGLVFAGTLDRVLRAYDDRNGATLWQTRLNDIPSSPPITYTAGGRQYIAIVAGRGGFQVAHHAPLVPEIQIPTDRSSVLWVFALPE